MRRLILALLALVAGAACALAEGEPAGEFDYYVMALSWSPAWCAETGEARGDPQCGTGRRLGWTLHGLWPQFETGWPSDCRSAARDPSRADTAAMADIMGGAGLAFHEWKRHGRCSGLGARDYFAASRRAFDSVILPQVFGGVTRDLVLPAKVIEAAFTEANPALDPGAISVICKAGRIAEVRICLTKDLAPRRCGADVIRECTVPDALLEAPR